MGLCTYTRQVRDGRFEHLLGHWHWLEETEHERQLRRQLPVPVPGRAPTLAQPRERAAEEPAQARRLLEKVVASAGAALRLVGDGAGP